MSLIRRTLHACTFLAVGAAGFFAPDALAFVNGVATVAPTIPMPIERAVAFKPEPITEQAAVRIELADGLGSGVSVGGGFIITAAHVVGSAKEVKVKTRLGEEATATVLWANSDYDIAMISTASVIPAADLSCKTAHVGDAITAFGNPLGLDFIAAYGKIAGAPRPFEPQWKSAFITDITTIMGQSGGPVFNDAGKLVGITVGVMGAPVGEGRSYIGYGFVVPSSVVCTLLGRVS